MKVIIVALSWIEERGLLFCISTKALDRVITLIKLLPFKYFALLYAVLILVMKQFALICKYFDGQVETDERKSECWKLNEKEMVLSMQCLLAIYIF